MSEAHNAEPLQSSDGRFAVYFQSAERMEQLPDESIDCVVTSQPYAIGLRYFDQGKGGAATGQVEQPVKSWGDYLAYLERLKPIWRETWRVMKPGAYACLNIAPIHTKAEYFGESFLLPIPEDTVRFWMNEIGAQFRWKYVWWTRRSRTNSRGDSQAFLGSYPLPLEGQVLREIEEVLVLSKPGGDDWGVEFVRDVGEVVLFRKAGGRGMKGLTEERQKRRRESRMTLAEWKQTFSQVWVFHGAQAEEVSEGFVHPAPFPEELPKRLIRGYSCVGDTVLDPFLGTGTTMYSARKQGRKCIGYEVESVFRDLIAEKTQILGPPVGREQKLTEVKA